jgi:type IV pilus assembly protein PilV
MLEVLVAILIVGFGLLGVAGLQSFSIRNNYAATQRTIATQLAYDIAERMRANVAAVSLGQYNYAVYSSTNAAGSSTAACLTSTGCTTAQLALQDIWEWNQQILAQLPVAAGTTVAGVICIDSTPTDGQTQVGYALSTVSGSAPACDGIGTNYVVKIWWAEDRNTVGAPLRYYWTYFQP